MRMKKSRVQKMYLKNFGIQKDKEGSTWDGYGEAIEVQGEAWPASGKVQAEVYGQRLPYIFNVKIAGNYQIDSSQKVIRYIFEDFVISEKDGLCLFVNENAVPDYRIISIKPYHPLRLEVEKI